MISPHWYYKSWAGRLTPETTTLSRPLQAAQFRQSHPAWISATAMTRAKLFPTLAVIVINGFLEHVKGEDDLVSAPSLPLLGWECNAKAMTPTGTKRHRRRGR